MSADDADPDAEPFTSWRPTPSEEIGPAAQRFVEMLLSMPPLQDLLTRVEELDERVQVLERLEARVHELEAMAAGVDDRRSALHQVIQHLYDLRERVDAIESRQETDNERLEMLEDELEAERQRVEDLQARLEAVAGMFDDNLLDGQHAHVTARERDPSDAVELGEQTEIVVEDAKLDPPDPEVMGRIDGLVTFVEFDDGDVDVSEGDRIPIVVVDHRDTAAVARPHWEVDDDA